MFDEKVRHMIPIIIIVSNNLHITVHTDVKLTGL